MGLCGNKKRTIVSPCRCNPRISYASENFPYKEFPPPKPPNGQDDLWELQFCRWWGWNWVRKKEINEMANSNQSTIMYGAKAEEPLPKKKQSNYCQSKCFQKKEGPEGTRRPYSTRSSPSPRSPHHQRVNCQCYQTRTGNYPSSSFPTKRELKDLCKCVVFQKPSRELPPPELQNLYNTPSQSVVLERQRYSFNRFNQEPKTFPCETRIFNRREKQKRKKCCATSWCGKSKRTSSEELICTNDFGPPYHSISTQARPASSTEESIEYLTVRMQHVKSDTHCPCQSHVTSKKQSVQTIRVAPPPVEDTGCQCNVQATTPSKSCLCPNEEKVIKYKTKKKKTLCICVCCCNCCKNEQNTSRDVNPPQNESQPKNPKQDSQQKPQKVMSFSEDQTNSNHNTQTIKEESLLPTFSNVMYNFHNFNPPASKQFSKFGNPSKKYPWLNNSFSNSDPMSDDTFTSPISGKTYNFAALQFNTNEKSKLPDLLDASKDLEYLKNIQSSIKHESEQKILFDAVCDALLSESSNVVDNSSSNILNHLPYESDFTLENDPMFSDLQDPLLHKSQDEQTKINNKLKMDTAKNIPNFNNVGTIFEQLGLNNSLNQSNKVNSKTIFLDGINNSSKKILTSLNVADPVVICSDYDQESFANQKINKKDSKVENILNSKTSQSQLAKVFQNFSNILGGLGKSQNLTADNLSTDIVGKPFRFDPDYFKEKPDFTKTGLLSAKRAKPTIKRAKRSALFTSQESAGPKKHKGEEKINFDKIDNDKKQKLFNITNNNNKNRKIFEERFISRESSTNLNKPFLDSEIPKTTDSNQSLRKALSLEKVKSSLENIFAKIGKMVETTKIKREKSPVNLPCLSEKSETEISTKFNKMNITQLQLDNTDRNSCNAFSMEAALNRSEVSSKYEINEDLGKSELESDGEKAASGNTKVKVNSFTFAVKSLSTFSGNKIKRKRQTCSKSRIPVRKIKK